MLQIYFAGAKKLLRSHKFEVSFAITISMLFMEMFRIEHIDRVFERVCSSVGLVLIFFDTVWGIYEEDFTSFNTVGYGYLTVFLFPIPFGSIYHIKIFKVCFCHCMLSLDEFV